MKNGGLIRLIENRDVARFVEMGYTPMDDCGEKLSKKPARKPKGEKPHGGA
jgi:hypothetical protein